MTSPFHTAYSILNFCILMRIAIIGTGYVGLVSGACFAEMGASVTCLDKDAHKINQLRNGIIPLYEPGLTAMVTRNLSQGRLAFESKPEQVLNNADFFFIAVGTPSQPDGQADLSSIEAVARQIGQNLQHDTVIVVKSTVPPGTCHRLKKIIEEEIRLRAGDASFELAFNPEFLKEGSAIKDFMSPDRIIIGADTSKAVRILQKLYAPFMLKNDRLLVMDTVSAEMSKYVSNSMLAARFRHSSGWHVEKQDHLRSHAPGRCRMVGNGIPPDQTLREARRPHQTGKIGDLSHRSRDERIFSYFQKSRRSM